ncbi:ficolin-3-like isoform X1 [Rhopilema esculentum]|uniref:ficolin-3-like isoform X1 n=1 Tax=Rhopilema esculentum TaxID=499914 RepID=UPI0031DB4541
MASISALKFLKFLLLLAVLNIVSSKYRSAFYKQVGNTTDDAALDLTKFHGCSMDDDCDVVTVPNKEGNESALVYKKVQQTYSTCNEIREAGWRKSDIYDLTLPNGEILRVYCDMVTADQGWILMQQKTDNDTSFSRSWDEYKAGFGDFKTNFWIGLTNLHLFTRTKPRKILFEGNMINGNSFIAIYHGMSIGDESQNFLLKTGRFIEEISTAYDSFTSCNGAPFTTFDRDNDNDDSNCAETYKGGWWYKGGEAYCTYCSFNTDNEPKWIGLKSKVVLIRILVG